MSFLKKLFGRDFDGAARRAEKLEKEGRLGEAVLAFRDALDASKGQPDERVREVREHFGEVRDALARQHIADGKKLASSRELERAIECFETAAEAAASEDLAEEARGLLDRVDAEDARAAFEEAEEIDDDERFEVLAGEWGDDQADELDGHGEAFKQAFLDMWDGKAEAAADRMAELVPEDEDAVYLHLVLAHAQLLAGRHEDCVASGERFLERLEEYFGEDEEEEDDDEEEEEQKIETEAVTAKVKARDIMAAAFRLGGRLDEAEKQLRALVELLPEKAAPYVVLGRFLRETERFEDALEVLEEGREFMGEMNPDMRVPQELGLTQIALDKKQDAIESLQAVIDHRIGMDIYDFPVDVAVPLAELYEETGNAPRAADLYRHLAAGTHAAGHFTYNLLAARLLVDLEDIEVARRHAARARELAEGDEENGMVDTIFERLGDPPQGS